MDPHVARVPGIEAQVEAALLEPLFEPMEAAVGPAASIAFEPLIAQLLERARGSA